jgi:hypothetical protein
VSRARTAATPRRKRCHPARRARACLAVWRSCRAVEERGARSWSFRGEGAHIRTRGGLREGGGASPMPMPTPGAVPRMAEPEANPVSVPTTPGGGLVRKCGSLLAGVNGSVHGRIIKRSSILGGLWPFPSADVEWPAPISTSSPMRARTARSRRARACPRRGRSSRTRRRRRPRTAEPRQSSSLTASALRKHRRHGGGERLVRPPPPLGASMGDGAPRHTLVLSRLRRGRRTSPPSSPPATATARRCRRRSAPAAPSGAVGASGVATVDGQRRRPHLALAFWRASASCCGQR